MRERNVVEEYDTDVEILHILLKKACNCLVCRRNWASVKNPQNKLSIPLGFLTP